jgi:uncharacterized protein (UPF0147 family)
MTTNPNPLDEATRLMKEEKYSRARTILLELIKREPNNQQAKSLYQQLPNVKLDDPWLPSEISWQERYINGHLVSVLVVAFLATLSTIISEQQPTNYQTTLLNLVLAFLFGVFADAWIQHSKKEDVVRRKAIEISQETDAELQRMASNLETVVSTLKEVSPDRNTPLPRTTMYMLREMLREMQKRLQDHALDIANLPGINQDAFLKSKGEKLGQIRKHAGQALKNMFPKVDDLDFFIEEPVSFLPPPAKENGDE